VDRLDAPPPFLGDAGGDGDGSVWDSNILPRIWHLVWCARDLGTCNSLETNARFMPWCVVCANVVVLVVEDGWEESPDARR
jgi:hypothetical protein